MLKNAFRVVALTALFTGIGTSVVLGAANAATPTGTATHAAATHHVVVHHSAKTTTTKTTAAKN